MGQKQGTNKAVERARKKRAGKSSGPRKHHGPGTGHNHDHVVVPDVVVTPAKPEVVTMKACARNGGPNGPVRKVAKTSGLIVPGRSVKPEDQRKLLGLLASLEATA